MPTLALVSLTPLTTMTSAVSRQMMMVSRKGSMSAAKPCDMGSLVRTVACAMGAEPMPASFANAARRNPWISAPMTPPATASRHEGFAHDGGERRQDVGVVRGEHDEAGHDVQQAHERRELVGPLHDALHAAEQHDADPDRDHAAEHECLVEARDLAHLRIGLADLEDGDRTADGGHAEKAREKLAEPRHADAAERLGHVVHRAAGHRAVGAHAPVFHGQRHFGELEAHAEEAGEHHPQRGAGPAERHRHRDAADAAEAHGAGHRGAQRLERRWLRRDARVLE